MRTDRAAGEGAGHGSVGSIGSQLAASEPLFLEPGGSATRGWRALVADGALEDDAVQRWAAETS